jgi:hypothetical protein
MSRCCDKPRHAAICDYMDACTAAIRDRFTPTFWAANVEHPLSHITIKLGPGRELAWTPGFGWRIENTHPAGGTPAGKVLYLAAGPVPPPAIVADRLTAWADGVLVLNEMQPHHRVTDAALLVLLRDAVSGGPVEYRCPHCEEWEAVTDPADEDVYCESCGTHLPLRELVARVTPAELANDAAVPAGPVAIDGAGAS